MTTIQNAGGGDYTGLPTKPIKHRGRNLPEGLPWGQITDDYVAAGGQVDAGVWHTGPIRVVAAGRRGSDRIHTFVEDERYAESASPAPKRGARHRKPVPPDSVAAPAAKPRATLSDAQRAEIAKRYVAGEHMPELAAAFGVGVGSVSWALKVHGVKTRSQAEARALAKTRNAS